jgi:transcriptional regulator with XRE-family HTH domain
MAQTYGDVIAANLRAARARARLSQTAVAARLQRLGYTSWDSSKVSRAERNGVAVLASELLALAVALESTVGELAGVNAPPDAIVEFPDPDFWLSGVNVRNSVYNFRDEAVKWDRDYPVITPHTSPAVTVTSPMLARRAS